MKTKEAIIEAGNEKNRVNPLIKAEFHLQLIICQKKRIPGNRYSIHAKTLLRNPLRVFSPAKTKGKGYPQSKNSLSMQERGAQK